MRLKPSCSWCKDYSKFIENIQLRILLQCYKRLALYIERSEISKKWASLQTGNTPGSSANSIYNQNNCPSNFKDLIDEASNLPDKYTFFEPPSLRNPNKSNSSTTNQTASTSTNSTNSTSIDLDSKSIQTNVISNFKILDKQDDHLIKPQPQATIVRLTATTSDLNSINHQHHLNHHQSNSLNSSPLNSINQTSTVVTPTKTKQHKIRKGCRCGLATLNPGKLTCCGQRCPCYVEGKACLDCRCRGCRNPNKPNGNNRTSPSFITSSSINISSSTNNLTTNTSPNLFTSSSSNNLQLNSSTNQTTLLSPASTRNLLSPSFLLSSSNTSSATLINSSNVNQMLRQFPSGTKIISSTSSSPSAAILLTDSGHNNVGSNVSAVGVDSLTLPFPNIENIEDQVILSENVSCIDPTLHHQSIIDN